MWVYDLLLVPPPTSQTKHSIQHLLQQRKLGRMMAGGDCLLCGRACTLRCLFLHCTAFV